MDIEMVRSLIGTRLQTQSFDSVASNSIVEAYCKTRNFPFRSTTLRYYNLKEKNIHNIVTNISNFIILSAFCHRGGWDIWGMYDDKLIRISWDTGEPIHLTLLGDTVFPGEIKTAFESQGFSQDNNADRTKTPVIFGMLGGRGAETKTKHYATLKFDAIKNNYTSETQEQVLNLINTLKYSSHGLVILHGPVGTGKTYLIRSILSELSGHRKGIVCVPPLAFLSSISSLLEVSWDQENPLIIFEDMGEIFQKDAKVNFVDHFSNLANLSDGLLSLLGNSVFLMTFNYEIAHLDPAMTREGRCIANINIPRLPVEYARKIIPIDLRNKLTNPTYNLAELYAMKSGKKIKLEKPQMGFQKNLDAPQPIKSY